jgi:hypothetical protein
MQRNVLVVEITDLEELFLDFAHNVIKALLFCFSISRSVHFTLSCARLSAATHSFSWYKASFMLRIAHSPNNLGHQLVEILGQEVITKQVITKQVI